MAQPDSYYVVKILEHEYGRNIVDTLSTSPPLSSKADELKIARRNHKLEGIAAAQQASAQYDCEWPSVVPYNVVLKCLDQYYEGSKWTEPPVCAVCGQYQRNIEIYDLSHGEHLNLGVLRLCDLFIIEKCMIQCLSPEFNYLNSALDGTMLDHCGIVCDEVHKAKLNNCGDCSTDLFKQKIPRFALANGLYWGELPDMFTDLTWVEEKICAIYCTTAHVTCLFQSSDPSQPKVFHGNTCAHDMNIISTASVLPRTPADVTGLLSVIFVGLGKFNLKQLGTVFRV